MPEELHLEVSQTEAGGRLDTFLADRLGSRASAQRAIEAGAVHVDGVLRPKSHLLSHGEVVDVSQGRVPAEHEDAGPPAPFTVQFEDEHLLVVEKPTGVVVHPATGHRSGTLAQALRASAAGGEDPRRAGIVHRLDRDTSGLLVVARSEEAHRRLKALLAARRLHREYVALVEGHPPSRTGTIDAPIGRDRRKRVLMSIDSDVPRPARTHFEVIELLPDDTLVEVVLDTGRTHQIRVHMAAIGHPVAGDPLYGTAGRHGLTRQFLHARRLAFEHPFTGESVDVASDLPEDLASALRRARASSVSRA